MRHEEGDADMREISPLHIGQAHNDRFDVSEMKDPLIATITSSGWSYVPVATKGKVRT